ncbi:MAG: prolyl oligopeptidase family serine peptidase [Betaproteobacteria bacterium]|nr:prolyl oligopeptidase family serine peptidase [Betaproteobacteria bacterium]
MARRSTKNPFSRSMQRLMTTMTRTAVRAGTKAIKQSLKPAPSPKKRVVAKPRPIKAKPEKRAPASGPNWITGIAVGTAGPRRFRLFKPAGVTRAERLPLLVLLHGCSQDAEKIAASSQMNKLATRERFMVLYPEQDRLANALGCWNWYDTRSGRAQGESGAIDAMITQVCLQHPVNEQRIAIAGFSAGAGLAALLATRHPQRFCAVAMHSGVGPGVAHSSATALGAMRGRRAAAPLAASPAGTRLPGLLVIQGSSDHIVASSNGHQAAGVWAAQAGAKPGKTRVVQRGERYAANITDYKVRGQLVATLCEIDRLGHAWSGGAAGRDFSDPKGPSASSMIWSFVAKQFADEVG